MARIVRAALLQAEWTGDKESMIQKHEKYAREAAAQGAKVMCFQELFYGPYFCQVQDPQYYSYTELIPDGPTTKRMPSPTIWFAAETPCLGSPASSASFSTTCSPRMRVRSRSSQERSSRSAVTFTAPHRLWSSVFSYTEDTGPPAATAPALN